MSNIMRNVIITQNKTRVITILTAFVMLIMTCLATLMGGAQTAYADSTLIPFPDGQDSFTTNTGAVKNFTITKLDDLEDGRYSDIYFYDNYDYNKGLNFVKIKENSGVYETTNSFWKGYDFETTRAFCFNGEGEIENPLSLKFNKIGYYRDGRLVDMELNVTFIKRIGVPNSNYSDCPAFIDLASNDKAGNVPNWFCFDTCGGSITYVRYVCTFVFTGTDEKLPSDIDVCFNYSDIDIMFPVNEQVKPFNENFHDNIYLSKDTKIQIYDSKDQWGEWLSFEAGGSTDDEDPTSMVLFHAKNDAEFQWGGQDGCGTYFGIKSSQTVYPPVENVPQKEVVSKKTPYKMGETITYQFVQDNLPILTNDGKSNAPKEFYFSDTLENVFDISSISQSNLSVTRTAYGATSGKTDGKTTDVTSNWKLTHVGQTIKVQANDKTGDNLVGKITVKISGIKLKTGASNYASYKKTSDGKYWIIPNTASRTLVTNLGKNKTEKTDQVDINVKRPVNITYKIVGDYSPANPPAAPTEPSDKYFIGDNYVAKNGLNDDSGYYDFAGWYTDEACTKKYVSTALTSDTLTLYGKWIPKPIMDIEKISDKNTYDIGDTATYTITAKQTVAGATANNVKITDTLNNKNDVIADGGIIDESSITVKTISGTDIKASSSISISDDKKTIVVVASGNYAKDSGVIVTYSVMLGTLKSGAMHGKSYTNQAIVHCDNMPASEQDRSDTAVITMTKPVLDMKKSVDRNLVDAGDVATYILHLSQTGTGKATNVGMTDTFPAAFFQQGGSINISKVVVRNSSGKTINASVTLDASKKLIIKTGETLHNGEWLEASIPVTFGTHSSNAMSGNSYQNIAVGTSDTVSSNEDNATVSVTNPVLNITKNGNKQKINVSETVTYNIVVMNSTENSHGYNATITDNLNTETANAGAYIDESTLVVKKGNDVTTDYSVEWIRNGNKASGFTIKFNDGENRAYGEFYEVDYNVVAGGTSSIDLYDTGILNTATATFSNSKNTVQDDNEITLYTPTLKIVKTAGKDTANLSESVPYTIDVTQTSPNAVAYNVRVDDIVGDDFVNAGGSYVRDSLKVRDPYGNDKLAQCKVLWTSNGSGFTLSTPISLSYNQTLRVSYNLKFGATTDSTLQGKEWKNIATAGADNTRNNVQDDAKVDVASPALSITKTVDKSLIDDGDQVVFEIIASQTGEKATAYNVVIKDVLPDNLVADGFKIDMNRLAVTGPDGNRIGGLEPSFDGKTLTINTGKALNAGEKIIVDIPMTIGDRTGKTSGHSYTNTATVSSDNAPSVSGTATVNVTNPVLSVAKSSAASVVGMNETNKYSIVFGNETRDSKAYGVRVVDSLDDACYKAGAFINRDVRVKSSNGTDVTDSFDIVYSGDSVNNKYSGFTVTAEPIIEYGKKFTIEYSVTSGENNSLGLYDTGIHNTARISCKNSKSSATDDNTVTVKQPALALQKASNTESANVSDIVTYTIKINETVEGAYAISPIISDSLATGFVSAGASYVRDSLKVTLGNKDVTNDCTISWGRTSESFNITYNKNLYNGESLLVTYDVKLGKTTSAGLQGKTWKNTATVTSSNLPGKQVLEDETDVKILKPKIVASKTVDKPVVNVDDTVTYTLTAKNEGDSGSIAYNVVMLDEFPQSFIDNGAAVQIDEITVTDKNGKQITANARLDGNTLRIDSLPDLISDNEFIAKVPVHVGNKDSLNLAGGIYENVLSVSSDNGGSNTANANVRVFKPILKITKTSDEKIVNTSDQIHYKIVVTNTVAGSKAFGVFVKDFLDKTSIAAGAYIDTSTLKMTRNGAPVHGELLVSAGTPVTGYQVDFDELDGNDSIIIEYEAVAGNTDSTKLFESGVLNTASCKSLNGGDGGKDENKVTLYTPKLKITKEADKDVLNVNDEANYHLTIEQVVEGGKAWNLRIEDSLSNAAFNAGAFIIPDSLKITDGDKQDITKNDTTDIKFVGRVADEKAPVNHVIEASGFDAHTGVTVEYGKPVTVDYTVKFGGEGSIDLAGMTVENVAKATGANDPNGDSDDASVTVYRPALTLTKESDREMLTQGDEISFLLSSSQSVDGAIATNISFYDAMPYIGSETDIDTDQIKKTIDITFDKTSLEPNDFTATVKNIPLSSELIAYLYGNKDDNVTVNDENNDLYEKIKKALTHDNDIIYTRDELEAFIQFAKNARVPENTSDSNDDDQVSARILLVSVETTKQLEYENNAIMSYSVMFGNVPEQELLNSASVTAGNTDLCHDDLVAKIISPALSIEKTMKQTTNAADYSVTVSQTVENSVAKQVVISDTLDTEAVNNGYRLNEVKRVIDSNGNELSAGSDYSVDYKRDALLNGNITGFSLTLYKPLEYNENIIIEYGGAFTKQPENVFDVRNIAMAKAWNVVDEVSDDASFTSDVASEIIVTTSDNNIINACIAISLLFMISLSSVLIIRTVRTKREL